MVPLSGIAPASRVYKTRPHLLKALGANFLNIQVFNSFVKYFNYLHTQIPVRISYFVKNQ